MRACLVWVLKVCFPLFEFISGCLNKLLLGCMKFLGLVTLRPSSKGIDNTKITINFRIREKNIISYRISYYSSYFCYFLSQNNCQSQLLLQNLIHIYIPASLIIDIQSQFLNLISQLHFGVIANWCDWWLIGGWHVDWFD